MKLSNEMQEKKEKLRRLIGTMSNQELQKEMGWSHSLLSYYKRRFGFSLKRRPRTDIDYAKILELIRQGYCRQELAKYFNCSSQTISLFLKEHGLKAPRKKHKSKRPPRAQLVDDLNTTPKNDLIDKYQIKTVTTIHNWMRQYNIKKKYV